jgi:hypothetical protein
MTKVDLTTLTEAELFEELIRRRSERLGKDALAAENAFESIGESVSRHGFEQWLEREASLETSAPQPCPKCGRPTPVRARRRERVLVAVSGKINFTRNYHYCNGCRAGFCPLDIRLGLPESGDLTPEMERRILDFGVHDTFERAAERWCVHYKQPISENLVRRVVERQGRMLESRDLERVQTLATIERAPAQVLIVQADGGMVPTRDTDRWREVKVGIVARQDCHLSSRDAPRGHITSARYAAHLGGVDEFRRRLDALLRAEKVDEVGTVVWVGDGAPWIWSIADDVCRNAVQVLDWFHAIEAASACAKAVFGPTDPCVEIFTSRIKNLLRVGDLAEVLRELEACLFLTRSAPARKELKRLIGYYTKNRERMNYLTYVARGYPIGSGFIEAANKHVIQGRMKLAGQHWDPERADRMANLRALLATTGAANLYDVIREAA